DFFPIQADRNGLVLYDDMLREPLVVLRDALDIVNTDVLHVIKAAALHRIPDVSIVDLYFEALARETALLKFRMEIDSAVRIGCRHHVDHKLEIFEVVIADGSLVEGMSDRSICHESSIHDPERVLIPADFPASEIFSIKE